MTRDELDQLMLLYACGVCDDVEKAVAEARLSTGDPEAQACFAEALATVSAIPHGLSCCEAPKRVRDQLLFRVTASVQQELAGTPNRIPWGTWIASGIAAVLAIALTMTVLDRQNLASRVLALETQAKGTRDILQSPYVALAKLDGQQQLPCSGRVLYCPVRKEYEVVVFNLSPPSKGQVYELWMITPDSRKLPAGTFTVDGRGNGTITIKAPRDVPFAVAAITNEPEGGVDVPTGQIHLLGNLQVQ